MSVGVIVALATLMLSLLGQLAAIVWFAASIRGSINHLTSTISALTQEIKTIADTTNRHGNRISVLEARQVQ